MQKVSFAIGFHILCDTSLSFHLKVPHSKIRISHAKNTPNTIWDELAKIAWTSRDESSLRSDVWTKNARIGVRTAVEIIILRIWRIFWEILKKICLFNVSSVCIKRGKNEGSFDNSLSFHDCYLTICVQWAYIEKFDSKSWAKRTFSIRWLLGSVEAFECSDRGWKIFMGKPQWVQLIFNLWFSWIFSFTSDRLVVEASRQNQIRKHVWLRWFWSVPADPRKRKSRTNRRPTLLVPVLLEV